MNTMHEIHIENKEEFSCLIDIINIILSLKEENSTFRFFISKKEITEKEILEFFEKISKIFDFDFEVFYGKDLLQTHFRKKHIISIWSFDNLNHG